MSKKPLEQQVVVITGASSGIGLATAKMAAHRGAKVVLGARDAEALDKICTEIAALGGDASFVACDVSVESEVERLADAARTRHGRIDSWANIAGVGIIAPLRDTTLADHRRLFETNYWGVVHGSTVAARAFREQQTAASIINVGSTFSDLAAPTMGAYSASKFAVKAFSSALRVELEQEGLPVSVTLIKPSVVDSMFYDHAESPLETVARIPPPSYAPSVVAEAIVDAMEHTRREVPVGSPAVMGSMFGAVAPRISEKVMLFLRESIWKQKGAPKRLPSALRQIPHEGHESSGRTVHRASSVTAMAQRHPWAALASLAGVGLVVGVIAERRRTRLPWQ